MSWEISILQMLQSIRMPWLTAIMEAITSMSESLVLVIIIGVLYWCIDKKHTVIIGFAVLFSGLVNGVIKNVVRAPRPFEKGVVSPMRVETATSYSFPSGHTQSATAFWASSIRVFNTQSMKILGITMILLTALTRLYLGVHWPTDVIAAIIIGLITVVISEKIYDPEKGFRPWHVLVVGGLALIFLVIPIEEDLVKTVGALWGFVVGCYIEQNYIHFNPKGKLKAQVKKVVIGLVGTLLLYAGLSFLFGDIIVLKMIKYGIVLLWLTAGAPYIFTKFKLE